MAMFTGSEDFRDATFVDLDMSGATFREVMLSGARMHGVVLTDVDIDGHIAGLRINGVDVAPLIEAELDRLHPERTKLRPTTPDGMREAWTVLDSMWAPTMRRARAMSAEDLHRSVNDEWSFVDTLRHLVFVIDAWFGHAILDEPRPFHPLGMPAAFLPGEPVGIDTSVAVEFDEVVRMRDDRAAMVRDFLATVDQDGLDRVREPSAIPGWPPPVPRTATACLRVIFNEEWAHHQFAIRDLAVIGTAA